MIQIGHLGNLLLINVSKDCEGYSVTRISPPSLITALLYTSPRGLSTCYNVSRKQLSDQKFRLFKVLLDFVFQ